MKCKIFLFHLMLLIYLTSLTAVDAQSPAEDLPAGAIARFSPGALVYTVAFSPNGELLASGGDDNAVILWDIANESERESFVEHGKSVMSIAFSPNGGTLASASLDGFVRLWPVSSDHNRVSLRHGGWVESVAFSPDQTMLASGGGDQEGSVVLWDAVRSRRISTFSGHGALVESVTFSSDGRLLASASRDRTIKLWDVINQRVNRTLAGHSNVVHAVAFSPNGEILASSSRDNTIKLWDVASGENRATFKITNSLHAYAEAIAFSPDGQLLAAACVDYTVRLWNIDNGHEVATLTGHHGGVTSVAFAPDGGTLASGSRDRTVLLWNLRHFGVEILSIPERVVPDPPVVVTSEDPPVGNLIGESEHPPSETDSFSDLQDTAPPEIVIQSPTERSVNSVVRQVPVKISVTDDSSIDEVWVGDTEAFAVSEAPVFSATVPLNFGENEIRITATDVHGHMGTDLFTIIREDDSEGPEIHIETPRIINGRGFRRTIPPGPTLISGTVTDPSGVAEVKVNGRGAQVTRDRFEATVTLVEGENRISVTAIDTRGNVSDMAFTVFCRDSYVRLGKDYALLFAVDTYDHWDSLEYPFVDAVSIQRDLEDIYGFDEVELIRNPTNIEVHDALHKYAQKEYHPEDQLLIFFAGHGDFNSVTNMGYLVSQDTKKPEEDRFRMSSFSHSNFRDIIDRMSCEHILLVMDTCYSGTFDERYAMRGETEGTDRLSPADIRRLMTYTTRRYLTSGGEQVPDNSKFIRSFLEALRSRGGSDNILTISEILTYLGELNDPKPCFGEFGRNAPGSDFLFFAE